MLIFLVSILAFSRRGSLRETLERGVVPSEQPTPTLLKTTVSSQPESAQLKPVPTIQTHPKTTQQHIPTQRKGPLVRTTVHTPKQVLKPVRYHLPAVQLIGAEKAGTTAIASWLFNNGYRRLTTYPGEPPFYAKESHFFDGNFGKGLAFYAKRFQGYGKDSLDASPGTLWCAKKVRSSYDAAGGNQTKELKIIVSLREPISRELSLYNLLQHECRTNVPWKGNWQMQVLKSDKRTVMTFDEFIHKVTIPAMTKPGGRGSSSQTPKYSTFLKEWFDLFDREQILVLNYDELKHNSTSFLNRIRKFLGRDLPGDIPHDKTSSGPYKVLKPSSQACSDLEPIYHPYNEELYKLLWENPGPPAEQRPFPKFHSCAE